MTITASVPATFSAERAWVIDVLLRHVLGLPVRIVQGRAADVELRADGHDRAVVLADGLFAGSDRSLATGESLPTTPLSWWDVTEDLPDARVCGPRLPVLFGAPREGRWMSAQPDGVHLSADLFGGAFVQLSRLEEIVIPDADDHGRLPVGRSLAAREGFLDRPVVNEYAAVLLAVMRRVWPALEVPGRSYRLVLSHDVDLPFCRDGFRRRVVGDVLRRRDPRLAMRRTAARLRPARPCERSDVCFTFDRLMDDAEAAGTTAAFYFICGGHEDAINGDYRLDDPRVRALLRRIAERGHEIGLHPSYDTWRDGARLRRELDELRATCDELGIEQERWGGRQHYLRWSNPDTWQNWSDAGLDYDSTLTFAGAPGFRCGICVPYPVFNVLTRTALPLIEMPLIVMEGSLLDYQGLPLDEALASIAHMALRCREVDGDFTLLWHNHRLITGGEENLWRRALEVAA